MHALRHRFTIVVLTVCVVFSILDFHAVNGLPDIIRIGNYFVLFQLSNLFNAFFHR